MLDSTVRGVKRGITNGSLIDECPELGAANPIYALIGREFKGTGTPLEETKKDFDYMKRALES